jgi:hypothetical protein
VRGRGTATGGYFKQIATPLDSQLQVLRPPRRWPTRPGEERIRTAVIPAAAETKSLQMQQLAETHLKSPVPAEPQEPPGEPRETGTLATVVELPGFSPLKGPPDPLAREQGEHVKPARPLAPDEVVSARNRMLGRLSGRTLATGDTVLDGERDNVAPAPDRGEPAIGFAQPRAEATGPASVLGIPDHFHASRENAPHPHEAPGAGFTLDPGAGGRLPVKGGPRLEREAAPPARIDPKPAKIQIGSIEVRVVNPMPVPPAATLATQHPRAQAAPAVTGGNAPGSGLLARGFRGPWGLRQG